MDKTALFEELFDEYRKIKKASSIIKEKTQTRKVFNHYVNHINYNFSSKQVVAKLLSNIGGKDSFKRALEYVEKNANKDLTKNYERVENAMEYISKHSPLLDEDNNIVDINKVLKDWEKDFGNKENSKDVWHLMFSIKEISTQKNLNILKKSVNEVMRDNFFGYKYVMALHTHQNNPHIHIILNKRNIFTKKKIHFENKQEISDFWDKIREDFKYSLNSYGLKYNNYSKLEKDLNKEYQKIKSSKLHNDNEHLNDSLYKILSKEETKEDLRRKTLNDLKMEYEELRKKKFELIDLMILYKNKNNKRYFKISKEIKSINQALEKNEKISLNLIKSSNKSKKKVFYVNQILDNNRSTLIDTLQKQKNFIRLFNEKIKKGGEITISDYRLLKEVEKSIKQNNQSLQKEIENTSKASISLCKVFSNNENVYSLSKKLEILNKNIYVLKKIEIEDSKKHLDTLLNNKNFIHNAIKDRMEYIEKQIHKNPFNDFLRKEHKKACEILEIKVDLPKPKISDVLAYKNQAFFKSPHKKSTQKQNSLRND